MTINLNEPSASLIILDIEGTTTPIDFVYKTLFPSRGSASKIISAATGMRPRFKRIWRNCAPNGAADAAQGLNPPAIECESPTERLESMVAYIHWLMDRDRKSTPLKAIQGRIWREGYEAGELLGEVFDDVPPAFARWRRQNKLICIYSSGSALAQKLLFAHTTSGDLTYYICRYFDTTIGHKIEATVIGGSPKNYGWP